MSVAIGAGGLIEPLGIAGAVEARWPRESRADRRYLLWRVWDSSAPRVLFVGLNPSTADATRDDPTVRRMAGFARREGAGGFELVNLISQRATDARDVEAAEEPDEADAYFEAAMRRCAVAVFAWGSGSRLPLEALPLKFEREVFAGIAAHRACRVPLCFGRTKTGEPRHPLYLPATAKLERFEA